MHESYELAMVFFALHTSIDCFEKRGRKGYLFTIEPARVLDLVLAGEVSLAFDDRLMAKYREVLARPKIGFRQEDVQALIDYLLAEGEPVVALPLFVTLPDGDDLPFLEVAAQANAVLITGNWAHYQAAPAIAMVLTSRKFLNFWGQSTRR